MSRMPSHTKNDEFKVGNYVLPDPLRLANGEYVRDTRTWIEKRRPEILRLFEQHQHGVTPSNPLRARYEMVDENVIALGGRAKRTQLRIRFDDEANSPAIRVLIYIPALAVEAAPTLLHVGFAPPAIMIDEPGIDVGMAWNPASKSRVADRAAPRPPCLPRHAFELFVQCGFAVAYVYYEDIEPDFQGGAKYGVRSLFGPQVEPRRSDEWGSVGVWSWGISRVLDYLLTHPGVDGGRVALSGVSRLGKAVLWAGAQDERFALVIPMLSGEGGDAISRRNCGESIADLVNPERFPYWFAPRYAEYANSVATLPVDAHMLIALIAPRPILQIVGSADSWADPEGEFLASLAAKPVYELFGRTGVGLDDYPKPNTKSLNDMGFFVHDGPHTTLPSDFEAMAQFMKKHLPPT